MSKSKAVEALKLLGMMIRELEAQTRSRAGLSDDAREQVLKTQGMLWETFVRESSPLDEHYNRGEGKSWWNLVRRSEDLKPLAELSPIEKGSMLGAYHHDQNAETMPFTAAILRTMLKGAWVMEEDLSGIDLSRADLEGARLDGIDLRDACLARAELSGADLSESNLEAANLEGADLSGACFIKSILRDTNLRGAKLCRAKFQRADLTGADFSGADIELADFSEGLNVDQALGLEDAEERGAIMTAKKKPPMVH